MKTDVIILAGGLGTRLREVLPDTPKPMAPVNGKPFLHYLLSSIKPEKIQKIILSVGYKAEQIRDYFSDEFKGIPIEYVLEEEPLGTGGAIKLAMNKVQSEDCFILNGDTYFDMDMDALLQHHRKENNDMTIALKSMSAPDRYGTVQLEGQRLTAFREKQSGLEQGLINAGIYVLKRELLQQLPEKQVFSFEKEVMEVQKDQLQIGGFEGKGMFIDIGIPEDYARAQKLFS